MRARIVRWGHRLALRVPRHLADAAWTEGPVVEPFVSAGGLRVSRVVEGVPGLDVLLAQITDSNQHDAVETGPTVGREAW